MLFYTVGDIAAELGEPVHRVQHVLKTRQIKPLRRAGNLRVFNEEAKERVRCELQLIDHRREAAAV
ncbi:hypothetical protein KOR34_07640 [Posidoniimonas corsicana]|uniref:Helix-turn-helix domain protein n=1 Tax=Posidoniimonas corsicana TaxID=1938618 RepID=A0A5C5VBF0_9BACT|nr:hypothetical protein [Posidoniimonas corsicana]TWT35868.1 hypothetical protein KOR34_07640 [Posidoniimonas corsicana]